MDSNMRSPDTIHRVMAILLCPLSLFSFSFPYESMSAVILSPPRRIKVGARLAGHSSQEGDQSNSVPILVLVLVSVSPLESE